jgi:hypothetical protein
MTEHLLTPSKITAWLDLGADQELDRSTLDQPQG